MGYRSFRRLKKKQHPVLRPHRVHYLARRPFRSKRRADQDVGALERCSLRPGNVHSADGWRDVLVPVVERHKERKVRLYFRGDAAFASPAIC